jgi:putative peptide modification system cyclase
MSESLGTHDNWHEAASTGQPVLRTMVVCDLADSTAMIDRLGDRRAATLLRKHDRLTRALVDEHGGREIDKTDGYLLLFERPTQAVCFALAYQRGLRYMSEAEEIEVRARVGIHVGDVVMWENSAEDISRGAKPIEVEGLAKPVAARMASLARPQQVLLSGVAATLARRGREEIRQTFPDAMWKSYGPYQFRGVGEAHEVVEVGDPQIATFSAPNTRAVARRIRPFLRRPSVLATLAVLLLAGLGGVWWWHRAHMVHLAFSARDWVVIGDLKNQTGDTSFDAAIDTAFRIGLKQSHYVNVISNAQVRQTAARMKLPDDAVVNRNVGSKIALHEHAKALIIPSVVNDNQGVRITADLIDPDNRRSVAEISATAKNQNDVVSAIDTVVRKLRGKLGESLAQIQSSSIPLAKATTNNLEALRAYSLSQSARSRGDTQLSLNLLQQALKLDPDFALAYATVAANYISTDRRALAEKAIKQALQHQARLSHYEKTLLHAQEVSIKGTALAATEAWKVLADLYPDNPIGAQNTGLNLAGYSNDCKQALPYFLHAAHMPQHFRGASYYGAATCQLALGEFTKAIESFKTSLKEGWGGPFLGLADAYVATRQYSKAQDYLNTVSITDATLSSLTLRRALLACDVGDLMQAEDVLRKGMRKLEGHKQQATEVWRLQLDLVGVLWAQNRPDAALVQTRTALLALLPLNDSQQDHLSIDYSTLLASYARWAARLGDEKLAQRSIDKLRSEHRLKGWPIRQQLVAITETEMALHAKKFDKAVNIATSVDKHPLWELLEIIGRAKLAAGDPEAIQALNTALSKRGLAFGEIYENNLGICTRDLQWTAMQLKLSALQKNNTSTDSATTTEQHKTHSTQVR